MTMTLTACGEVQPVNSTEGQSVGSISEATADSSEEAETGNREGLEAVAESLKMVEEDIQEGPRIEIAGVYYGDLGSDDAYQDLYIVFDYVNDGTNRTMPISGSGVAISVISPNVYYASDNDMHRISWAYGAYEMRTFDYVERYTGYRYPVGYGDVLGGSDPIRMFVHTLFNPNDLENGETITLTIGEASGGFPVSEAIEISVADEVMRVEPEFETAQILAAEKWRLDSAIETAMTLSKSIGRNGGGGDHYSGMSQSMKNLFSPVVGGLSVFEDPSGGFVSETHTYFTIVDSLPAYDHDVVMQGYSEVADKLDVFESQWNALADSILDPGTSLTSYEDQINELLGTYRDICDTLGIGRIKNL